MIEVENNVEIIEENVPQKNVELLPPSNTLYIKNLNEKISISEMKETLMEIFSQYGEIIQITVKSNIRLRGQCFIVFSKIEEAKEALEDCQGDELFDKNMEINFAKEKSDIIAKLDGTYVPKEERPTKELKTLGKKRVKIETQPTSTRIESQMIIESSDPKIYHKEIISQSNVIVPNNILFIEGIPDNVNEEAITFIYHDFTGFREVRMIRHKNMAFVEFDDEFQSGIALSATKGARFNNESVIKVSYAKK